jgi:hypothetical protein
MAAFHANAQSTDGSSACLSPDETCKSLICKAVFPETEQILTCKKLQ